MNYTFRKATAILFSRIVLTQLDNEQRSAFRKVEKLTKQYTKIKSDLKYLNFCSVNQILPKFTNFKLYDVSAENDKNTIDFKRRLLQREIDKKEQALVTCGRESGTTIVHMMRSMPCLRFYSSFLFLQRLLKQYECDILHKHMNKLRQLYAGSVVLPESKNNIINLSSYQLTQQEENLLNHGLNFSIKSKINPVTAKIEMEKLFFDVKCNESQRKIEIHDEADLKVKLQNFAIKNTTDHSNDSITKEERAALNNLKTIKRLSFSVQTKEAVFLLWTLNIIIASLV